MKKVFGIVTLYLFLLSFESFSCTNFLFTKSSTTDGSTMITYAADAHVLYGELYFREARNYPEGAMFDVYDWDTRKYLGKIKQLRHTYSVVGNMNEHQLSIGETTYGGRSELRNKKGIIDYGSLMYLTLQRAKNAREAIKVMADIVEEYGYYSSGESFSIADPNEVWIMEMIGKGEGEKGAVWVALQIPEGYICAHANQARITTFDYQKSNKWNDPNVTVFNSPDVITFARKKGYIPESLKDKDFSFSDTYAPVGFGGARFCEIRVWSMFKELHDDMEQYFDYAKGHIKYDKNGYATNRMPLWIKPKRKVHVRDVMNFMRDHLEGTELDMRKDIGAGPFECPYRWRPLTWEIDSVTYCNERATATQQTGFSFVAQARSWLPDPIGGILWFGVDDAATCVYVPMYCGMNSVPYSYAVGNGSMLDFSWNSAFWVFNWVSNFTYLRYNVVFEDVKKMQDVLEEKCIAYTPAIDLAAQSLYQKNKELAIQFITDYSCNTANNTVRQWKKLGEFLMVKYIDGNIKKEFNGNFEVTEDGVPVNPDQPEYPDWWYREIIKQNPDQFKVIGKDNH
jgi:dipeptidase